MRNENVTLWKGEKVRKSQKRRKRDRDQIINKKCIALASYNGFAVEQEIARDLVDK